MIARQERKVQLMTKTRDRMAAKAVRRIAAPAIAGLSALVLSGCMGPTYGTGKSSTEQLFEDLGSSLSLAKKKEGPAIEYTPRPDIVKPVDTSALPAPQARIAETPGVWPESPEERRKRVLAEIEEGKRDPNFITNPDQVAATGASEGPAAGRAGARRVYLTDPPVEYRVPAETAEYGDLGQTEAAKARAAKAAQGKNTGWRRLLPWL